LQRQLPHQVVAAALALVVLGRTDLFQTEVAMLALA
jgi:hypothetical protein